MSDKVTIRFPAEAALGLFNRHRERCNCPPPADEMAVTAREATSLERCADYARDLSVRQAERSDLARLVSICRDARRRLDTAEGG